MKPIWTATFGSPSTAAAYVWGQSSFTVGTMKTRISGEQQELVEADSSSKQTRAAPGYECSACRQWRWLWRRGWLFIYLCIFLFINILINLSIFAVIYLSIYIHLSYDLFVHTFVNFMSLIFGQGFCIPSVRWWKSMDCLCINLSFEFSTCQLASCQIYPFDGHGMLPRRYLICSCKIYHTYIFFSVEFSVKVESWSVEAWVFCFLPLKCRGIVISSALSGVFHWLLWLTRHALRRKNLSMQMFIHCIWSGDFRCTWRIDQSLELRRMVTR